MASLAHYEAAELYIRQAEVDSLIRLIEWLVIRYHCGVLSATTYAWAHPLIIERLTAGLAKAQLARLLTHLVQVGEQVDAQLQLANRPVAGQQLSLV